MHKKIDPEQVARVADQIADEHSDHDCGTEPLMRMVSGALRGMASSSSSSSSEETPGRSGPAQVATPAYRENWETLFGKKQPAGQA